MGSELSIVGLVWTLGIWVVMEEELDGGLAILLGAYISIILFFVPNPLIFLWTLTEIAYFYLTGTRVTILLTCSSSS
jgi:hypothetical protein